MKHKDRMKKKLKKFDFEVKTPRIDSLEKNLQELGGVVSALVDEVEGVTEDLSILVRKITDLQDRFESDGEEQVVGESLHDYDEGDGFQPIVSIEHSNVTGSPYKYLYIYLTPRLADGPHIIVSDAKEFRNRPGICVGRYDHYEFDARPEALVVTTAAQMIAKIQELMDEKDD